MSDALTRPEPGDYILHPAGQLGSRTAVSECEGPRGGYLGNFEDDDAAFAFIRERCESEQFWPDVWQQDDHGGCELVTYDSRLQLAEVTP